MSSEMIDKEYIENLRDRLVRCCVKTKDEEISMLLWDAATTLGKILQERMDKENKILDERENMRVMRVMAEYISRDDLLNVINANVAEAHNERCSQLLEAILNTPNLDVVEVVRCKDCEHWKDTSCDAITEKHWGECRKPLGDFRYCETAEYDFCSYGERKEEE